jgi:hypothetical protein
MYAVAGLRDHRGGPDLTLDLAPARLRIAAGRSFADPACLWLTSRSPGGCVYASRCFGRFLPKTPAALKAPHFLRSIRGRSARRPRLGACRCNPPLPALVVCLSAKSSSIWKVTAAWTGMPGTGPLATATVSRARAKRTGTPPLGCAVAGLHDHRGGVRRDVMVELAPALLRGRAAAPGGSRTAPARRSCIFVARVTVAGERLGYICVRRVRFRPSLSWTFPPQNSRGAASAAFFGARAGGDQFTALDPMACRCDAASQLAELCRIIAQYGRLHTPP